MFCICWKKIRILQLIQLMCVCERERREACSKWIRSSIPSALVFSMLTSAGISWNSKILLLLQLSQGGAAVLMSEEGQVTNNGWPPQEYLMVRKEDSTLISDRTVPLQQQGAAATSPLTHTCGMGVLLPGGDSIPLEYCVWILPPCERSQSHQYLSLFSWLPPTHRHTHH